jgi:hypothetical protein
MTVRGATVRRAGCLVLGAGVVVAQALASVSLGVVGRQNANASMAAAGNIVVAAWSAATEGGVTDVFAAVSVDGGRAFGLPVRVNDVVGDARLSGEQPARVSLVPRAGADPSIVVTWTSKGEKGTRLLQARSDDRGRSFAKSTIVSGSDAAGNRGWESTAVDRNGRVIAMWLDHRALAPDAMSGMAGMAGMNHDGQQRAAAAPAKTDSVMKAQLSKLYIAGAAVTGGVCYCCKTALATGPDGAVYAAWRHVYAGNIRDIAFTVSRDNAQTFAPPLRVSSDKWMIDGCPEDGPAIAVDRQNRIHIVWPTLVPGATPGSEPAFALFYAMSTDGRRFTARQRLPTERTPHHPQIVVTPAGKLVVAWDEGEGGLRRVAWARGTLSAAPAKFVRGGVVDYERAVYPVLAATSTGVVLGWTGGPADASRLGLQMLP